MPRKSAILWCMKPLDIISLSLEFIGNVIIALTVLRVHQRFLDERKFDRKVIRTMKREQLVAFAGVACLATGFLLRLILLYGV